MRPIVCAATRFAVVVHVPTGRTFVPTDGAPTSTSRLVRHAVAWRENRQAWSTVEICVSVVSLGSVQSLAVAAARYRLGGATGESLRGLGVELLAAGNDAAMPLAIMDDFSLAEVGPVFDRVCQA